MATISIDTLSDRDLLERTVNVAIDARHLLAELLALLGEVDSRRLYLGEGCSSLFTYCTQVLRLSEHAAYHRIEAARAARRFPVILSLVADGSVTLTTVAMLRPHLTPGNHPTLLSAARHKSKREVEHQIAGLAPRPDAPTWIRRLPVEAPAEKPTQKPAETEAELLTGVNVAPCVPPSPIASQARSKTTPLAAGWSFIIWNRSRAAVRRRWRTWRFDAARTTDSRASGRSACSSSLEASWTRSRPSCLPARDASRNAATQSSAGNSRRLSSRRGLSGILAGTCRG